MADSALGGQRAIPARAQSLGYHFRYPEIDIAFRGSSGTEREGSHEGHEVTKITSLAS